MNELAEFNLTSASSDAALALLPELSTAGPSTAVIAAVVAGVVLLLVLGARSLRSKELASEKKPPLEAESAPKLAPAEAAAPQEPVEAPVAITGKMSLKEIKAAKKARLTDDYKTSDVALAEKEQRMRGQRDEAEGAERRRRPRLRPRSLPLSPRRPLPLNLPPSPRLRRRPAAAAEGGEPAVAAASAEPAVAPPEPAPERKSLSEGLQKTRGGFFSRLGSLFSSSAELDEDLIDELEELLFTADIGVKSSQHLLEKVQERFAAGEASDPSEVYGLLREEVASILRENQGRLDVGRGPSPFVVLVVGVNGAGKTTTIGKLAAQYRSEGRSVMMVAGDTFRAAAVNQLERWSERVGCSFYRGADEADPSSVVFDGIKAAVEEGVDVVLCDTAGRLQTKAPLMDELRKIGRVAAKALDGCPHETVLVLDANTGQNAIQQAKLFGEAVPLTGLVLTKLDGTAKGGVIIGISQELGVPITTSGSARLSRTCVPLTRRSSSTRSSEVAEGFASRPRL